MAEPQLDPAQRPRKVRFRISSACSGRLLKQVYEDGQALEPPAVEQSRRLRHSFEPGALPDGPALGLPQSSGCGEDGRGPGCPPAGGGLYGASPVIDFGQIIIYTNNLKIIRAPMDQRELMRRIVQTEGVSDWAFVYRERRERVGAGHKKDAEKKAVCNQYVQVRENWKHFCFLVLAKPFSVPIRAPSMSACVTSAQFGLEASLCSFLHLDVTEQHSQHAEDRLEIADIQQHCGAPSTITESRLSFCSLTRPNTAAVWLRLPRAKILVSAETRLCLPLIFSWISLCWSEPQLI
uniref:Glutaredoxin and cysteine rich domain containing 2 n=1 Tax=Pavo cristatus TaxID=9049 RepID=A0A8C9G4N6_PAVCR